MKILFNNLELPSILCLTKVPNILTILSDNITGSKAGFYFTYKGGAAEDSYLTINNVTVTAGIDFTLSDDKIATVTGIVKALRNTGLVDYDIYLEVTNGLITEKFYIKAKEIGSQYEAGIINGFGTALNVSGLVGSSTDEFIGYDINVDIYKDNNYITTLTKTYYKEEINFNISSVLDTITNFDEIVDYKLIVYGSKSNSIKNIGYLDSLQSIKGYLINEGLDYIGNNRVLQNFDIGNLDGVLNKSVLYIYDSTLPLSVYKDDLTLITINYLDDSEQKLYVDNSIIEVNNKYGYKEIGLTERYLKAASYVNVIINDIGTIKYKVIKPILDLCQRLYFHNSYGGVSFFDFTEGTTVEYKVDNNLISTDIYKYYEGKESLIYSKETTLTYTSVSCLIEKNGTYIFNDLLNSYDVWTYINEKLYKVNITDLRVEETDTGVYKATVVWLKY